MEEAFCSYYSERERVCIKEKCRVQRARNSMQKHRFLRGGREWERREWGTESASGRRREREKERGVALPSCLGRKLLCCWLRTLFVWQRSLALPLSLPDTLKLTCLFSNTKTPCFLMCTWSFFVKATPLISLSLCCFSTPYPQCVCVCVSLLLLLPKNILYWTPQFLVMKTDKGLHCNKSTVVSFAFSCSTNSGSQSGPELLAISFFSNSGTFQMLAGQWLVANLPAHAQVYAPQW